ncbi:MAG: flagellar brake domain-containing protein [Phycisphaerae bacterium]|nr:flagellar brake domain-containing protein [Phycisphaerae bacterium]
MAMRQSKSFTEVTFLEAVARRIRVYLISKPVTPETDGRLRSRFLGAAGPDHLILDVPVSKNRKVCVPVGWEMGMSFSMGQFLLQARTTVLDHCQFQLYPTRRVDGLVVHRPSRILSLNRRSQPRYDVDPSAYIMVSLWLAESLAHGDRSVVLSGQLINRSESGLGIKLAANLPCSPGTEIIIRMEKADGDEWPIFQAIFKHCTQQGDEEWLAGFGDVSRVEPGQYTSTIESLVIP